MARSSRQSKILELISTRDIGSQDDLVACLKEANYDITQATISRDIKDEKYLNLAKFFIDNRGCIDSEKDFYNQSHLPVREQTYAIGHAVRALYMYTAMADMALITGDNGLTSAVKTIFDDVVNTKTYVTGGTGSSFFGENFTTSYDLKNTYSTILYKILSQNNCIKRKI